MALRTGSWHTGLEVYNVTTHAFMFFIGGHPESNAPLQRSHGLTEAVLPSTGQLFFTTFVLDPNDDHVYIYDEERTRWLVTSLTGESMTVWKPHSLAESLRVRGGRAGCSQLGVSRLIVMVDEVASPHRGRLVVLEKGQREMRTRRDIRRIACETFIRHSRDSIYRGISAKTLVQVNAQRERRPDQLQHLRWRQGIHHHVRVGVHSSRREDKDSCMRSDGRVHTAIIECVR